MEQSVCMSLPVARPIVHMLLNSPVTAKAAMVIPSKNAPATADLRYALTIVSSFGGLGGTEAQAGRPRFALTPISERQSRCGECCRVIINHDQPNSFRPLRGAFSFGETESQVAK